MVENIGPTPPTVAALQDLIPLTLSISINYKGNSRIGSIPLSDITVDLVQIKTAKTLTIKDNRLFLGNVSYADLKFDRGTPTVTSGQVLKGNNIVKDPYSSDIHSSTMRVIS